MAWDGAAGETVEGKESSGRAESRRDGDEVSRRQRRIQLPRLNASVARS